MKILSRFIAVILTSALLLSCTACGTAKANPAADSSAAAGFTGDPIKIGFIGCISGSDAYLGQTAVLALQDKVEEINQGGGILGRKVVLVPYDIGLDPTPETVNATNRLIDQDKVVAIIGPESSDQAIAAVDIVQNAQVPMLVTTASNETVTVREDGKLNDYMFRMCFIDSYQGEALAHYAYEKLGLRKVAIIGDISNLYTQAIQDYFVKSFKELGGTITGVEGFVATDTEFRAPLTNIKNSDAEAMLIACSTYKVAGYIGKQCKELGINMQILGVDGWYSNEIITFAGKELSGAKMACMMDDQADEYKSYREAFAQKHPGQTVNYFAYYALDALLAIKWAIEEKQSAKSTDIQAALHTATDVPLFTCNLTVDPKTHNPLRKPVYILEVTPNGFVTKEKFVPAE